jgi:ABC-type transport system substrate-binding protein
MAEGHEVSAHGKTYTIRLREGLKFHDGEPVRARDCVASLKRWAARDGFGQTVMALTDELSALDDRTLQFGLKGPSRFCSRPSARRRARCSSSCWSASRRRTLLRPSADSPS